MYMDAYRIFIHINSYRNGHLKVVKFLLLNSRVDVNAISTIDWTPLHFACEYVSIFLHECNYGA